MNPSEFDSALRAYQRRELPSAPANMSQNVWREIRRRQDAVSSRFGLEGFLNWFRAGGTSLSGATVLVALVISVGLTLLESQPSHREQAREALGLTVFSHQASPLTRWAQNP